MFVESAVATSDAVNVTTSEVTANIPQVGNIWSAAIPTEAKFPKTTTYPCGYIIIPVKGLLPYSVLGDKANGTRVSFDVWSDAGAKVGSGSISSYDWNPVGAITQAKIFICGENVLGVHTLLTETQYYTSTNGLLSRYLSTKTQSKIKISLQAGAPATILDFKLSLNGNKILTSWSAPSSEAPISNFEIGLFDTNPNSPLPPLGADLKTPVVLTSISSPSLSATFGWEDVLKATSFQGSSIVFKVRSNSDGGAAQWSNGIYLTKNQYLSTQIPPKPSIYAVLGSKNSISVSLGNAALTDSRTYNVSGWVIKIRRQDGTEQIGTVNSAANGSSQTALLPNLSPGDYELSAALINSAGQSQWGEYVTITVPIATQTPAPSPKLQSVQKRTIICLKALKVKKITGLNPKCPTGYKLKK